MTNPGNNSMVHLISNNSVWLKDSLLTCPNDALYSKWPSPALSSTCWLILWWLCLVGIFSYPQMSKRGSQRRLCQRNEMHPPFWMLVKTGCGLKYLKLQYCDEFSRSYEKFSLTFGHKVQCPRRFILVIHLFETTIHPRFSAKKSKEWTFCSSTQTVESSCLKHYIILNWCVVVFALVSISFFHPWWFYST